MSFHKTIRVIYNVYPWVYITKFQTTAKVLFSLGWSGLKVLEFGAAPKFESSIKLLRTSKNIPRPPEKRFTCIGILHRFPTSEKLPVKYWWEA
jgi:hypothetical protein